MVYIANNTLDCNACIYLYIYVRTTFHSDLLWLPCASPVPEPMRHASWIIHPPLHRVALITQGLKTGLPPNSLQPLAFLSPTCSSPPLPLGTRLLGPRPIIGLSRICTSIILACTSFTRPARQCRRTNLAMAFLSFVCISSSHSTLSRISIFQNQNAASAFSARIAAITQSRPMFGDGICPAFSSKSSRSCTVFSACRESLRPSSSVSIKPRISVPIVW